MYRYQAAVSQECQQVRQPTMQPYNVDSNGAEESVSFFFSGVLIMYIYCTWGGKRCPIVWCPQFRGVLIEECHNV